MKLNELMQLASAGYPDGLETFYDDETGEPLEYRTGDTLARFVVVEISETFDADLSDAEQIAEAVRVMSQGRDELQGVVDALQRTSCEERQTLCECGRNAEECTTADGAEEHGDR